MDLEKGNEVNYEPDKFSLEDLKNALYDMIHFKNDAKFEYDYMLKYSGMFFEFYSDITGVWEKDKDFWLEEYKRLTEMRKQSIEQRRTDFKELVDQIVNKQNVNITKL
jgi:hypothetical protein